jgi:hypothetical protein
LLHLCQLGDWKHFLNFLGSVTLFYKKGDYKNEYRIFKPIETTIRRGLRKKEEK